MAYNKVVFDGETLIDLTADTVTPDDLRTGVTAHDMSGAPIVGTMAGGQTGTVIADLPYQEGRLYYNGTELTPTWTNYDPEITVILFGTQSAVEEGTYSTYFYLAPGYVWPDGSSWLEVTWEIRSNVIYGLPYQDGELYYNGTELTPTWANYDPEIMEIWGAQSATNPGEYEVTFFLADGYTWPNGTNAYRVTWTITYAANPNFGENTPAEIQRAVSLGVASSLWSVGDRIAVTLNGAVSTYTFEDETYYAFILGFDHNADAETGGRYSLTLQFGKTEGGTDIAFRDPDYDGGTSGTKTGFRMNSSGSNSGGWESCWMRQEICPAFFEALPAEWREVVGTVTKYQDNAGSHGSSASDQGTDADVWGTDEQIFLLAEYEIFGSCTNANRYEPDHQRQYAYYAAGNSTTKYKHFDTGAASAWWGRSAYCGNSTTFCAVNSGGNTSYSANHSLGFAPAFCIV